MPHHMTPTIETGRIELKFTCTEDSEADCRTTCSGECESWNTKDGTTCEYCGQPLRHGKDCNPIAFLHDDPEPLESYEGDSCTLAPGEVVFEWQGDYYTWRFALPKDAPNPASSSQTLLPIDDDGFYTVHPRPGHP